MRIINSPKGKTIHVVTRYFYPVIAGLELNILNTYAYFAKKGWTVTIHTSKDIPSESNVLSCREQIRGMSVKRYDRKFHMINLLVDKDIYEAESTVILHDLDILGQLLVFIRSLILKTLRVKKYTLIFSSHGLFSYDPKIYPGIKMRIRTIFQNTIGVYLINSCVDGIRAVSDFEKKTLVEAGIKESLITVITNGLEAEAFADVEKSAGEKIKSFVKDTGDYTLQVGRIDRVKNYEVAIKALKKLPSSIKYVIVGHDSDISYKKELLTLIEHLGIKNRVVFLGIITGVDKYYLMKHALAMVHMSRAEGFSNVVHEGMSQGLVCIVSKNTALEDLIKDSVNGYCLDPDDYEGLARKISFVLKNKTSDEILKMKKRNKEFAAGHSWKNVAKKVEDFYLSIKN